MCSRLVLIKLLNVMYKLYKYDFISYCQGTKDRGVGYALIMCNPLNSASECISALINKVDSNDHVIDRDSIEDLTIIVN